MLLHSGGMWKIGWIKCRFWESRRNSLNWCSSQASIDLSLKQQLILVLHSRVQNTLNPGVLHWNNCWERPFTMPSSQLFVFVSDIVFGSCSFLSDHSDKFSSGSGLKNVLRQQTKPFVWAENIWIWILVICIINKVFLTYIWSNHKQNQGLKTVQNCVISAVNSREILRFLS